MQLFRQNERIFLKFIWKYKRSKIAITIPSNRNTAGRAGDTAQLPKAIINNQTPAGSIIISIILSYIIKLYIVIKAL